MIFTPHSERRDAQLLLSVVHACHLQELELFWVKRTHVFHLCCSDSILITQAKGPVAVGNVLCTAAEAAGHSPGTSSPPSPRGDRAECAQHLLTTPGHQSSGIDGAGMQLNKLAVHKVNITSNFLLPFLDVRKC